MAMTTVAAAVVVGATLYWLDIGYALERIAQGITTDRALTAGGLGAGLLYGDLAIKAAVGFIGGTGVLAIGDVINLDSTQFAVVVLVVIALLFMRGGD